MARRSILGLLFQGQHRDVEWIKTAWFDNDWVTLAVTVALQILALVLTSRRSTRYLLLWLGMLAYAVYNYAYYLFGASLNAFLRLHVVALVLSVVSLC